MILILNHKANLDYQEILLYEKKLRKYDVIVMPTTCYLPIFNKGKYTLSSQDVSEFEEKNRTGEINAIQLKSLNVKYVLIGHNERRKYNKETKEILNKKITQCLNNNIIPLYCIGEKNSIDELYKQIDDYLNEINVNKVYIVYEPINNIDSTSPNLNNIENNILNIKKYISNNYNIGSFIIYGGGVNANNIDYLNRIKEIDGVIFSNNSLDINNVKNIYKKINK